MSENSPRALAANLAHKGPNASPPTQSLSVPDLPTSPLLRGVVTAIEGIHSEPDLLKKNEKLQKLAEEMPAVDVPAVLDYLWNKQYLSQAGQDLRTRLIQEWAKASPETAADWIAQRPAGEIRREALGSVAAAWADSALDAAVAWARLRPDLSEREQCLVQIAYETARTAPAEAMKLAVELPESQSRDDLLAHAVGQWAGTKPQVAAEWVSQIEAAELRERLLAQVTTIWSDLSPVDAAEFALKSMSQGGRLDDAVVGIVQRWVQKDPEKAAAWVARFPEGTLRDTAMENLVQLWADQEPTQVALWLNDLPLDKSRDHAVGAFVTKLAPLSPESAARWAADIVDESLRLCELEAVGESWMASDAPAARAWIAESPLSASAKARLLALKQP